MSIRDILIEDVEFFIQMLSLQYPFTENEVERFWNVLVRGDAHYSVFLSDTDDIYTPELGMSYNIHIQWTQQLRSKWTTGFMNPFTGSMCGDGEVPLSLHEEIERRNLCMANQWHAFGGLYDDNDVGPEQWVALHDVLRVYPRLDEQQFISLYEENKEFVLLNRSIWSNTILVEISSREILMFLEGLKHFHGKQQKPSLPECN